LPTPPRKFSIPGSYSLQTGQWPALMLGRNVGQASKPEDLTPFRA
jgi:hypothetical protein